MKKFFVTIAIALIAAICSVPLWAEDYNIKIGGKAITSDNYKKITKENGFDAIKSGTVSYAHDTRTLTLTDVIIEADKNVNPIDIVNTEELYTIKLEGDNKVTAVGKCRGINNSKGSLRITGSGKVSVSGDISIFAMKRLTFDGGCNVNASAQVMAYNEDIIIDGVEMYVKENGYPAFWARTGIELKGGSMVVYPEDAVVGQKTSASGSYYTFMRNEEHCTEVRIGRGTGINETKNLPSLAVYPNPVKDVLNIATDKPAHSIRIYNAYGSEVAHATDTNSINVSHFPTGVYMVCADGRVIRVIKE